MKIGRNILIEAKADTEKLIDCVGQKEADRFARLKDRLQGQEKDLYYWLKKEPQELTDRLDEIESKQTRSQADKEAKKGAELVAENDYYKVYKINTFDAAKKYGANTKWCITGKESGWIKDDNENKYWKQYTDKGIEFYFFIGKKDNHKYALASHPSRRNNYEIFDETDKQIDIIPNGVEIKGVYRPALIVNGIYIRGDEVVGCDEDIKNAIVPDGVVRIGSFAFNDCIGLTSVTIGNSVTNIGRYAFSGCISLTSVIIPNSVTSIGKSAFSDCTSLESITISDSVTSIGSGAFFGCTGLTSVTISNSVTSIGDDVFWECTALTSITIPDSVTSIGEEAFWGCTSLTSITYTGTMAQWSEISKGLSWNYNTGAYTIHCADGTIEKDTNESLKESVLTEIYPNKGESKKSFIKRFISATRNEYPDIKQRIAVAYSYWDRRDKKEEGLKEEIFRYPETPSQKQSLKHLQNDGYKLEIVPLKKIIEDNDLENEDALDYHKSIWNTPASEYSFNEDKIKDWSFSDGMYAVRNKEGKILLSNGRHRCRALYNSGYTHIEIPILTEEMKKDMKAIKEELQEWTTPTERGLASVLSDLIKAQWDIVDQYNSAIATFEYEEYNGYLATLKDLVADETANIGMLEGLIQKLDPTVMIDQGKAEIENEIEIG